MKLFFSALLFALILFGCSPKTYFHSEEKLPPTHQKPSNTLETSSPSLKNKKALPSLYTKKSLPPPLFTPPETPFLFCTAETSTSSFDKDWSQIIKEEVNAIRSSLSLEQAQRLALLNNQNLNSYFKDLNLFPLQLEKVGFYSESPFHSLFNLTLDTPAMTLQELWRFPLPQDLSEKLLNILTSNIINEVQNTLTKTRDLYSKAQFNQVRLQNALEILKPIKQIKSKHLNMSQYGLSNSSEQQLAKTTDLHWEWEIKRLKELQSISIYQLTESIGLNPDEKHSIKFSSSFTPPTLLSEDSGTLIDFALHSNPQLILLQMQYDSLPTDIPEKQKNKLKKILHSKKTKVKESVLFSINKLKELLLQISIYDEKLIPAQKKLIFTLSQSQQGVRLNTLYTLGFWQAYFETSNKKLEAILAAKYIYSDLEKKTGTLYLQNKE